MQCLHGNLCCVINNYCVIFPAWHYCVMCYCCVIFVTALLLRNDSATTRARLLVEVDGLFFLLRQHLHTYPHIVGHEKSRVSVASAVRMLARPCFSRALQDPGSDYRPYWHLLPTVSAEERQQGGKGMQLFKREKPRRRGFFRTRPQKPTKFLSTPFPP